MNNPTGGTITGTLVGVSLAFVFYAITVGRRDLEEHREPSLLTAALFLIVGGIGGGIAGDRIEEKHYMAMREHYLY